jgi:Acetyltransferase (GNAT) family
MLSINMIDILSMNENSEWVIHHSLEEQTFLLKNNQNEVEGGLVAVILYDRLYITKFWLNHHLRGFSYGSILLNEASQYAVNQGLQSIEMGSNLKYIKTILVNNQFKIKSEQSSNHLPTCSFYTKSLKQFKLLQFKHHHQVELNPSEKDLQAFSTYFKQEARNQLKDLLSPCLITAKKEDDEVALMMGYLQNKQLYIDHYWLSENHQTLEFAKELLTCFEQFAANHQIRAIYIEEAHQDSKDFYLNHGFEVLSQETINFTFKKILIA